MLVYNNASGCFCFASDSDEIPGFLWKLPLRDETATGSDKRCTFTSDILGTNFIRLFFFYFIFNLCGKQGSTFSSF